MLMIYVKMKGKLLMFVDELAGKKVGMRKTKFILGDLFKDKKGSYFEELPKGVKHKYYIKNRFMF